MQHVCCWLGTGVAPGMVGAGEARGNWAKAEGDFSFSSGGFGVGTNAEEGRNSGIGDAQEGACTDFVTKLVAQKSRLEW